MRHKRFPKHKGTHFRVRLIVKQMIERMVERHRFASAVGVFVKVERQSRNCLIHRRHLHGRTFRHRFPGCRPAEEAGVVAACRAVLRLVSGFEKA